MKQYFDGIEKLDTLFELYNPDEIIKSIVADNYSSLNSIEIRDFITECLNFYTDYEQKNPKIFEARNHAIQENEAFEQWEDRWLSPD